MAEDEHGVELEKPLEIVVRVEDVNDNPPVCNEGAVFEVQENEPIGNTVRVFIHTLQPFKPGACDIRN